MTGKKNKFKNKETRNILLETATFERINLLSNPSKVLGCIHGNSHHL